MLITTADLESKWFTDLKTKLKQIELFVRQPVGVICIHYVYTHTNMHAFINTNTYTTEVNRHPVKLRFMLILTIFQVLYVTV